jgi:hypothetical protein
MSSTPMAATHRESDGGPGQLGLALESGSAGGLTAAAAARASAQRAVAAQPAAAVQAIDLTASELDPDRRLSDLEHPVTAYLNGLAPSSRRPQLSALDWIARRATQLYTAETMPWHQLRRPHVLRSGVCSRSTTRPPRPTACSPRCAGYSRSAGKPSS